MVYDSAACDRCSVPLRTIYGNRRRYLGCGNLRRSFCLTRNRNDGEVDRKRRESLVSCAFNDDIRTEHRENCSGIVARRSSRVTDHADAARRSTKNYEKRRTPFRRVFYEERVLDWSYFKNSEDRAMYASGNAKLATSFAVS